MIEKSWQRVHGAGYNNLSLAEADTRHLPFANRAFDVVYSSYMLDILSVQDIIAALKEFRRVLKGSGRVILVNLSKQSPQNRTWVEYLYKMVPNHLGAARSGWLSSRLIGGSCLGRGILRRSAQVHWRSHVFRDCYSPRVVHVKVQSALSA